MDKIEKIIVVKSTEMGTIQSGRNEGGQYLKVYGSDDRTYSIFDEGLWNLFQDGLAVNLILEKNPKGYWNVTNAKAVAKELEEVKTEPKSVEDNIRKNMEWKDKQIEQKFWWGQLGECLRTGEIDKATPQGKLLRIAYYAEMLQVLNLKIEKKGTTE